MKIHPFPLSLLAEKFCKTCVFVNTLLLIFGSLTAFAADTDIEVINTRLRNEILKGRAATDTEAGTWLAALKADGSWPDINYDDKGGSAWQPANHLTRMLRLAVAYHRQGHSHYRDTTLQKGFVAALEYYIAKNPVSDNWWFNLIGEGLTLGEALIAMQNELTPEQISTGSAQLTNSTADQTGQNLVWVSTITIYKGCLQKNADYLAAGFDAIKSTVIVTESEGIQVDGSFHQHGAQLYSGGYGSGFVADVAYWMFIGHQTSFTFTPQQINIFSNLILDGHQWMVRGKMFDYSVLGREITRQGISTKASSLITACQRMATLGTSRQAEFTALAAHINGQQEPVVNGNRHFWRSDFMAHHRPAYYSSVRMYSSRLIGTERINDENIQGYYLPSGANYIYRRGDEYTDIFPVWDWTRIPGVTCQRTSAPPTLPTGYLRGTTTFVGGVSDGKYGVTAFDYNVQNVKARKSWFYFDEGFFCLGAGISSTTDNPITTSINQSLKKSNVTVHYDGASSEGPPGEHLLNGPRWVHHDGIGYVFPAATDVVLKNDAQSGSWKSINNQYASTVITKDVFSLWFNHGTKPQEATYQYAVVPGMDPEELSAYTANLPMRVLSNTKDVQAVRHESKGITGIAFYTPGTLIVSPGFKLSVDQPCLVLTQEEGKNVKVTVSNPTNSGITVNVQVTPHLVGTDANWLPDQQVTQLVFTLPGGAYGGQSITKDFGIASPQSFPLTTVADAYVRDGSSNEDSNFGTQAFIQTKTETGTGFNRECYFLFDISSVPGEIKNVRLKLYGKNSHANPTVTGVYGVDTNWREDGITWRNKPDAVTEALDSIWVTSTNAQYYEWDVTDYVIEKQKEGLPM